MTAQHPKRLRYGSPETADPVILQTTIALPDPTRLDVATQEDVQA